MKNAMPISWHQGHCSGHGRYACRVCKKTEASYFDHGLFVWRADGWYPRANALRVFKTQAAAQRSCARIDGNVVVRSITRSS